MTLTADDILGVDEGGKSTTAAREFAMAEPSTRPAEISPAPYDRGLTADKILESASSPNFQIPQKTDAQWKFDETSFRLAGGFIGGALATPESLGSLTLLGAALGQEISGKTAQLLNNVLFEDGQFIPKTLYEGAKDIVSGMIDSSINVATDYMMGGLGSRLLEIIPNSVKKVFGSQANRLAKRSTEELYNIFQKEGIRAQAGIMGGPIVKGSETALAKLPTSAKMVQESIDETVQGISRLSDEALEIAGKRTTPHISGKELQGNIESWVANKRHIINTKYTNVGKYITGSTEVPMRNTMTVIENITGGTSDLADIRRIQFPKELKNIMSAIANEENKRAGTLTWADANRLRTGIYNIIGDTNINASTPKEMLKKVHVAMMTDLEGKISAANPGAKAAWESARDFTRRFHQKKEIVSNIANSSLGREAFDSAVMKSTKTPEVLKELKFVVKSADAKEGTNVWNDFVSTYLYEFSRATPANQSAAEVADFSINNFIKNYKALKNTGSSKILFGGRKGLEDALDTLYDVSLASKDVARFANPSGTASQNQFMNVLTGRIVLGGIGGYAGSQYDTNPVTGAAAGAGLALLSPLAFGKLVTNKTFVRWLAQGAKIKPYDVKAISSQLSRLVAITKVEPEIRDAVHEYLDTYKAQNIMMNSR